MMAEKFVATDAIRAAVKGRETEVLDGLNIPWRNGKPHITCPYPDHTDNHPSWRWDQRKARAFCTCGSYSILDVLIKVERIEFDLAKIRAAELLKRPDLIKDRRTRKRKGGGGNVPPEQHCNGATPPAGCTLAAYAQAKQLPVAFLRAIGLTQINYQGLPAIRIPYPGIDGCDGPVRFRIALHGQRRLVWKTGSKSMLYGLNRLGQSLKAGYVVICEGESDCHTLWLHDFPALGLPGATNWDEQRDAPLLAEISTVYIVIEPDKGGDSILGWLRRSSIAPRVRLVRLKQAKDPNDLYIADPTKFPATFKRALDEAEPYCAITDREAKAEADRAAEAAGDLIAQPNILARFVVDLRRAGLVGEDRNAKILYLAITTRLLDRLVSVAVKGPSSGGKSFTVEVVLRFFPLSAYWERTALSDRALAYSDEDFRHRHLVIYEAAGMTSEFAGYLLRSLLSERRISYKLVEKTKDGMRSRLIEKEGPTGLIVTTTAAKLHPENETRLLSLAVKDTPQQTKAILHALARGNGITPAIEFVRWQAFQTWLETGERRVAVPFAERLADLVPPVAVRLRRDFQLLLTLIEAHALLHRERRDKDDQGRIIATAKDYGAVRELVADLFAEGVDATVKPEIQETVAAVAKLKQMLATDEISLAEIANALKLDRSATSRRVAAARSLGYLVNNQTRKGRPAGISLGDRLPGEMEILPHWEQLADYCSVAPLKEGIDTPSPPADCDPELAEIEI
jgi:hypothetical protein